MSNADDSYEDAIPLVREKMTQGAEKYYILLKDSEQDLYPNCKTFTNFLV